MQQTLWHGRNWSMSHREPWTVPKTSFETVTKIHARVYLLLPYSLIWLFQNWLLKRFTPVSNHLKDICETLWNNAKWLGEAPARLMQHVSCQGFNDNKDVVIRPIPAMFAPTVSWDGIDTVNFLKGLIYLLEYCLLNQYWHNETAWKGSVREREHPIRPNGSPLIRGLAPNRGNFNETISWVSPETLWNGSLWNG